MMRSKDDDADELKEAKLPRRDWILLPLLSLLTIVCVAGSVELAARKMFGSAKTTYDQCMISNDPIVGERGIPNCVVMDKAPEGELAEYRFNTCGFRTEMKCGPKPAGSYRIVMVGSSTAMGLGVKVEKSFATLLPVELSRRTGRNVELYNEGILARGGTPGSIVKRFNEVVAAEPDMILWILMPWDINHKEESTETPHAADSHDLLKRMHLDESGVVIFLQHFLYESQSQYVKASLMGGPDAALLKATPSAETQDRIEQLDINAGRIASLSKQAGVPVVAVLLPDRAEAAMISMGNWPAGYDPYKLGDEVRSIITSHGESYVDVLPDFRSLPNAEQYYFPVDGHLDAHGHAFVSGMLANGLTAKVISPLNFAPQPVATLNVGR